MTEPHNAVRRVVRSALRWPVESQQGARRNALLASTALAQRRHEHEQVEEFLVAHARRVVASRPPKPAESSHPALADPVTAASHTG